MCSMTKPNNRVSSSLYLNNRNDFTTLVKSQGSACLSGLILHFWAQSFCLNASLCSTAIFLLTLSLGAVKKGETLQRNNNIKAQVKLSESQNKISKKSCCSPRTSKNVKQVCFGRRKLQSAPKM